MVERTQNSVVEIFQGLVEKDSAPQIVVPEKQVSGYKELLEIYGDTIENFHTIVDAQVRAKQDKDGLLTAMRMDEFRNRVMENSDITKEDLVFLIKEIAFDASLGKTVDFNEGPFQKVPDTNVRDDRGFGGGYGVCS